jgi:hypothetical protein
MIKEGDSSCPHTTSAPDDDDVYLIRSIAWGRPHLPG